MKIQSISDLTKVHKTQIIDLWNAEYPESLNYRSIVDFEKYLSKLDDKSHTVCLDNRAKIIAWYIDFIRDNERYFAIIVGSKHKGTGLGTKLLNMAKNRRSQLNGWVIDHNKALLKNGEVYESPLQFYLNNDFILHPEIRLELPTISAVKISWTNSLSI